MVSLESQTLGNVSHLLAAQKVPLDSGGGIALNASGLIEYGEFYVLQWHQTKLQIKSEGKI